MQSENKHETTDSERFAEPANAGKILSMLREAGMYTAAARAAELYQLDREDPAGDPAPNAESLRAMARVLLGDTRLQNPHRMSISHEGFFVTEWTAGSAELALLFHPTGRIRYLTSDGKSEFSKSGTADGKSALKAVDDVISQIRIG